MCQTAQVGVQKAEARTESAVVWMRWFRGGRSTRRSGKRLTSNRVYLRSMASFQTVQVHTWLLVALALSGAVDASSQVNQIDATLFDSSRGDRQIPLDIRLPSEAAEAVPWVVFGHGFFMPTTDYDDLATALVSSGYAVVLVDTETSFAPSHEDFGLDLVYAVEHAATDLDVLEGVLSDRVALMGHSMGGGAAWLAASQVGDAVDALVGLAPAETTPSAIAAGSNVVAPTMVISGSSDVVTPPIEHHEPLYDATSNANCRAWVNLVDGGHCGFADDGTLCDLGEITFAGMSRPEQQAHTLACVTLWLEIHLQGEDASLSLLEAYVEGEADVELGLACTTQGTGLLSGSRSVLVGPNPAANVVHIRALPNAHRLRAFDMWGRALPLVWANQETLDISSWPRGSAILSVQSPSGQTVSRSTLIVN